MDRDAVLAAFDAQIRRHPVPDDADGVVEQDEAIVRTVSSGEGWSGVTWSALDRAGADAAIAAQVRRYSEVTGPWEWKHYSYDEPSDLPERLLAAGFTREPAEALLIAEIGDLVLDVSAPVGVRLQPVLDQTGIDALVAVHNEVFGGDHSELGRTVAAGLARSPSTAAAVVAVSADGPVAAGRIEFHAGTDFASLWGGGTLEAWRGRGLFRSLVAHRAGLAAARGYRYLQVDALPASRPILERLGFVQLATTTPFLDPGRTG
jgi:GNAT superfamily N-acetyltransferase